MLSCAGDDCGLTIFNTRTGAVQTTQAFEDVAECRNRACYVVSPDGTKVLLYVQEQVYGINLVLYDIITESHMSLQVFFVTCFCMGIQVQSETHTGEVTRVRMQARLKCLAL